MEVTTFDPAVMERFWAKVDKTDTCWNWTAGLAGGGYGYIGVRRGGQRKNYYAHRITWEAVNGPIPEGLEIDHLCRNRRCVNPDHLEPVTRRENQLRGQTLAAARHAKTHCSRGHEFNEANTYILMTQNWPHRKCRQCGKENAQRYRDQKKVKILEAT